MKKYKLIKYTGIALFPLLSLLFVFLYFIPGLDKIGNYKKELKDIDREAEKLRLAMSGYENLSARESEFIKTIDSDFKNSIPVIKKDGFSRLFLTITDYFREAARESGISEAIVSSDSKDLQVSGRPLFPVKHSRIRSLIDFTGTRVMRAEKKEKNSEQGDTQKDLSVKILFKDLKSSMIAIGFKGNMKSAAELINRITWINYFTEIEEVYAGRGSASANFLIKLRVFYREQADE